MVGAAEDAFKRELQLEEQMRGHFFFLVERPFVTTEVKIPKRIRQNNLNFRRDAVYKQQVCPSSVSNDYVFPKGNAASSGNRKLFIATNKGCITFKMSGL